MTFLVLKTSRKMAENIAAADAEIKAVVAVIEDAAVIETEAVTVIAAETALKALSPQPVNLRLPKRQR